MKKLMVSAVAMLMTVATLSAQSNDVTLSTDMKKPNNDEKTLKKEKREERKELRKMEGREVSYQSKESFYTDFGDVQNVTWSRSTYFDEATFIKDNNKTTAFYDQQSNLVGTTSPRIFADLPANAQKQITKKYKGFNVEDVIFFDDNEFNDTDMLLYGSQFDDADNYFVELKKDNQQLVLQVDMSGNIFFFKDIK